MEETAMSESEREPAAGANPAPPRAATWWPRLALAAGFVAAVAIFYAAGLNERLSRDNLLSQLDAYRAVVADNPAIALLVFFAVYVSVTALSLPVAAWLSLLAGALFGRWAGTAVVILAATLGATLAFLATRYLFREFVLRRFGGRLAALNAGIEREGAYYLFTLRLIPLFPFWLINVGMGLTSIRATTFAWVSLLGMLPGTFLYVNAGTELANIRSPRDVVSLPVLGSLGLLGLFPLVLRKLIADRNRRRQR
jgi:uncharacterized membrane protein YdjX (TVP38/TMEM64 family)